MKRTKRYRDTQSEVTRALISAVLAIVLVSFAGCAEEDVKGNEKQGSPVAGANCQDKSGICAFQINGSRPINVTWTVPKNSTSDFEFQSCRADDCIRGWAVSCHSGADCLETTAGIRVNMTEKDGNKVFAFSDYSDVTGIEPDVTIRMRPTNPTADGTWVKASIIR